VVRLSISACSWFLQGRAVPGFLNRGCWIASTPHGLFQICILLLSPSQRGNIPLCIWPSVFSNGIAISSPVVLEYVVPSQTVYCAYLRGKQIHLVENGSAAEKHRQAVEVLCPLVFGGTGLSRSLQQQSLCGFLCCIIVWEVADTLRWREICADMWQLEVLCPHILWWVQILPDNYRSLLFSVLCFSFTDPSRRELRERKKRGKK
jgi:hypothetical protein